MEKKERWPYKTSPKELCSLLGVALIIELCMIILANYYVGLLSVETTAVTGILESVHTYRSRGTYGLQIHIKGDVDVYEIQRATSNFGRAKYGVEGDGVVRDMEELQARLLNKIGREVRLEYIQFAENVVLRLTIDDEEYIDKEEARRDHIADQRSGQNIFIVLFVLTAIGFALTLNRLRQQGKP